MQCANRTCDSRRRWILRVIVKLNMNKRDGERKNRNRVKVIWDSTYTVPTTFNLFLTEQRSLLLNSACRGSIRTLLDAPTFIIIITQCRETQYQRTQTPKKNNSIKSLHTRIPHTHYKYHCCRHNHVFRRRALLRLWPPRGSPTRLLRIGQMAQRLPSLPATRVPVSQELWSVQDEGRVAGGGRRGERSTDHRFGHIDPRGARENTGARSRESSEKSGEKDAQSAEKGSES